MQNRPLIYLAVFTVVSLVSHALDASPAIERDRPADAATVLHALGRRVVFVNFDGVTLTQSEGGEDATQNTSLIVDSDPEVIEPFDPADMTHGTGGLTRQEIIDAVIDYLYLVADPYDIEFTTERPESGPYTMVVVGGTPEEVAGSSGMKGVAVLDCGDHLPSNVVFVFPNDVEVEDLGWGAAYGLGNSFGLASTDNPEDVMFWNLGSVEPPAAYGTGNIYVPGTPDATGCDGITVQDAHQTLLGVIGPRGQDVEGPTVTITTPAADADVSRGDPIQATATDDSGVDYLEAQVSGETISTDDTEPYEWTIPLDAPTGEQAIRVRAYDTEGNNSFAQIVVNILGDEEPGCDNNDDCDPGEVCDENGDCVPEPDDDDGGGCFGSVAPRGRTPLAPAYLAALALLLVLRRRCRR